MELGGVNRASAVTTSGSVVNQHSAQTGESSAAPDLSPQKTVQAARAPEAVDVQISEDAATTAKRLEFMRQVIANRVEVDPETRQLLFQSVRQRTESRESSPASREIIDRLRRTRHSTWAAGPSRPPPMISR